MFHFKKPITVAILAQDLWLDTLCRSVTLLCCPALLLCGDVFTILSTMPAMKSGKKEVKKTIEVRFGCAPHVPDPCLYEEEVHEELALYWDSDYEKTPHEIIEEESYHDRLLRPDHIVDKNISWRDPRRSVDLQIQKISGRIEQKLSENPFQLPGINVYRAATREMDATQRRALIKQNIRSQRGERSLENTAWITLENSWDWDGENEFWNNRETSDCCSCSFDSRTSTERYWDSLPW